MTSIPIPRLPRWKVLAVSNCTPGKAPSGPHELDKSSFNEVLQKLFPTLFLTVPDKLEGPQQHCDINLSFTSLKDFSPDSILAQVPQCRDLLRFKELINSCRENRISGADPGASLKNLHIPSSLVSKAFNCIGKKTPSPGNRNSQSGKIDTILDMLDVQDTGSSDSQDTGPSGALHELMHAISGEGQAGIAGRDIRPILEETDTCIVSQLNEIIHAPAFIELETAWRELKFLVDRIDFRRGVELDLIACAKEDIQKTLYDKVFHPVWKGGHTPFDLIIISHPFGRTPPDQELLERLAELAQSTQTLIAAAASPRFFDAQSYFTLAGEVPSIASLMDGPGYENWRAFRDCPESDWTAMTAGCFPLRNFYGKNTKPVKTVDYSEPVEWSGLPLANGSIAAGALLVKVMTCLAAGNIDDIRRQASLHNMEPVPVKTRSGKVSSLTTAAAWTNDMQWEMADNGLMPLSCPTDSTDAVFGSTTTVRKDGVSAAKALLSARMSHIVLALTGKHGDENPDSLAQILQAGAQAAFIPESLRSQDTGIAVAVTPGKEKASSHEFTISVKLPSPVFGEDIAFEIAFTL
ncbi:MAG: hypothetical protein GF350_06185 [Chitinivibrionales bacterium]|nr:hypothetical protein [Chitinivibrionales bacterium]